MQQNIKLSASTEYLNDRHLIIIATNHAPDAQKAVGANKGKNAAKSKPAKSTTPPLIPSQLLKQLDPAHALAIENIAADSVARKLGHTWNLPATAKSATVSLITSGTGKMSKVSLEVLKVALKRCVRQAAAVSGYPESPAKLQVCCGDIDFFKFGDVTLRGADMDSYAIDEIIPAIAASLYSYDEFKAPDKTNKTSKPDKASKPAKTKNKIELDLLTTTSTTSDKSSGKLKQLQALIQGLNLAKDLANAPPNLCTPPYLAAQAKQLAKQYKGMSCKVLGEKEMTKLGMNAYLAVTEGSIYPPQLAIMEYMGGKKGQAPLVIIGKGMTFDTGGVSIKPSSKMDEMKYDMCGAASVIGTMKAVAEMRLPVNLVGMAVGAENSVDGKSYRPGDIIRTMSGRTVEILNTDAEGRLVLCDTLTYAARYKPRYVVDIATLTGACVVALGHLRSGMFATDDELAQRLEKAAATSHDLIWQLPLDTLYMNDMQSNFADVANSGGRAAGTITAAGFLAEFAGAYPWAHLDIAGTAWDEGVNKGATGRPVSLLTQFVMDTL